MQGGHCLCRTCVVLVTLFLSGGLCLVFLNIEFGPI